MQAFVVAVPSRVAEWLRPDTAVPTGVVVIAASSRFLAGLAPGSE